MFSSRFLNGARRTTSRGQYEANLWCQSQWRPHPRLVQSSIRFYRSEGGRIAAASTLADGKIVTDDSSIMGYFVATALGFAIATVVASGGNSGHYDDRKSLCEQDSSEEGDPSVYVSSSDPMMLPSVDEESTKQYADVRLRPIQPNRNLDIDLRDPTSPLRKSIMALGSTMALDPLEKTLATSHGGGSTFPALLAFSLKQTQQRQRAKDTAQQEEEGSMTTPEQRVESLKHQFHDENTPVTTRKAYFYKTPQIGSSVVAEKLTLLAGPSSEVSSRQRRSCYYYASFPLRAFLTGRYANRSWEVTLRICLASLLVEWMLVISRMEKQEFKSKNRSGRSMCTLLIQQQALMQSWSYF